MSDSMISRRTVRTQLLHWLFGLLYGPLLFLHEPVGHIVFGQAWPRRRSRLLALTDQEGTLLDLGCGSGILLAEADDRSGFSFGIDQSLAAARAAGQRGVQAVNADARWLPVQDASVDTLVCSYPGPWIFDPATWNEIARILRPRGEVIVLLGGTIERGTGSALRSILMKLVYGSNSTEGVRLAASSMGHKHLTGRVRILHDRWGASAYWSGRRI